MSKDYTPGPWTLTHVAGQNFAVQQFRIRGMFGDSENVYPIFNQSRHELDGADIFCSPANARLISAAPDLLEALEACIGPATHLYHTTDDADGSIWDAVVKARAAIAKASPTTTDAGVAG